MKEFNKTQELRKIKFRQNKNTYVKRISIILSCVILVIGIIMFTFAKFESNKSYTLIQGKLGDYSSGDLVIAFNIDGINTSNLPTDREYFYLGSSCTNGAEFISNDSDWKNGVLRNLNEKGTKCILNFTKYGPNSVANWLEIANINKSYTTLNEVFNDTDTLNTLTNNNSSCDYLKNSTEWISDVTSNESAMTYIGNNDYCGDKILNDANWKDYIINSTYFDKVLNVTVPPMTDNTTPSGKAISIDNNSLEYVVFRENQENNTNYNSYTNHENWYSGSGTNRWIGYMFENPVAIRKAKLRSFRCYSERWWYPLYSYKYQYSDDGQLWEDVTDTLYINAGDLNIHTDNIGDDEAHQYWRLMCISSHSPSNVYCGVHYLQFYGR